MRTSRKWTTGTRTTSTTRNITSHWAINSNRYNQVRGEGEWRMGSYRNVYAQVSGGTRTTLSPNQINKWIRYVNAGTRVYKFNANEFTKYFGRQWTSTTPTAARQWLKRKYGPGIKDVTRGKGNCWLVATTRNVTGRPWNNYNWM
jgi:hypothetical protein